MSSSVTVEASASTLSGASMKTAKGNDFMNVGGNMVKFENVNLTVNTHCATGDGASEVRKDTRSGPIVTIIDFIGTLMGGIVSQKSSETNPISSGSIPQQLEPNYDERDHSEPFTETADIMTPASSSASDTTVSSLTQSSFPERYIRSMLECNQGHPLYEPEPESQEGVRVGDVGLITENGGFDFLFNVCPQSDISPNPDELPENFEMLRSPDILVRAHFQSEARIFNTGVKRTEEPDVKYACSGPEGGVLELPSGATRFEAKNKLSFKRLATRHAENWYRYTVLTKDRDAPNGSLYIVTSCIKCTDWGIAVFDRPSNPQHYLRFITNEENENGQSKYRWKGSGSYIAKVVGGGAGSNDADSPNQCVFLRGYKIMLPKDIWDNITNPQSTGISYVMMSPYTPNSGNKSESPRQGDSSNQHGSSQSSADNSSGSNYGTTRMPQNTCCRMDTSARVILYEYSKSSPAHPSDLINAMLLCQEPKAKVALTHDDDWCDLLQYRSQILDSDAFAKVSLLYTSNVDEYGCASLKRSDLSPNVTVVESRSDTRVTSTLENHLPIDSDDLAVVRQDGWRAFNATTRSSTPHSQCGHHSISSTTATIRSDVNRAFACEQSTQASGLPGRYPYSTAGAGSSGQLASPQTTLLPHYFTDSGDLIDSTRSQMSEEEDDDTSEHDYISSQESADIESADVAEKFHLSFGGDKFSRLSDGLRLFPILAYRAEGLSTTSIVTDQSDKSYPPFGGDKHSNSLRSLPVLTYGAGRPSTTSIATNQSDKFYQFHLPFGGDNHSDLLDIPTLPTSWNIKDLSFHSPAEPSTSGPPVIKLENIEYSNLRAVGSRQIQHAAGKRRKKDGIYQCLFRNTGCDATFTRRHNLRYHINAHLGLKPYECGKCSYAAASPANIKRHRATCKSPSPSTEQRVISQLSDSSK